MRSLVLFLAVSALVFAQPHWPQFRGPDASGVGPGATPAEWDAQSGKNVQWKRELPGLAHSSPVIWGERIYLTTAVSGKEETLKTGLYGDIGSVKDDAAHEFKVLCLDRKTGKILWESTPVKAMPKVKRHPKSTHANPTPATDGKHLVVFFGSEGLYTYDMKGKLLWKKDLGMLDSGFFMVPSAQWGFASSPVIYDGKILIQADVQKDSFLAALDVKTGKELWRTARTDVPTWSTPAVAPYKATGSAARRQVVVNGWKHIGGYDFETGKELWKMAGAGDIPVPTPIVTGDLIIITNAHGPGRPIYAIRTDAAGDLSANKAGIAWSHDRAGNYMQTPLVHDGIAYFCFDNGVLTAYDVASGKRLYQERLGSGSTGFSSSPVAAGGHLYITSEDGETHVIALGPTYKLVRKNDLGEQVMATPAIAGDTLYIRGRKHLYAIGAKKN